MNTDYSKSIENALQALSDAIDSVDEAENGGEKIHPSIGNTLVTAKLMLSELMADLSREEGKQFAPEQASASNTQISYLYRDASNYKVYNECVVSGLLSKEQQETIISCLSEGEFFIPHQVGLPEQRFDGEWTEDDHCWFELDAYSFEETKEAPTVSITADELVEAFCQRKDRWDDTYLGAPEMAFPCNKAPLDSIMKAAAARVENIMKSENAPSKEPSL